VFVPVRVDVWYVCELERKCTPCASDECKVESESARARGFKKSAIDRAKVGG